MCPHLYAPHLYAPHLYAPHLYAPHLYAPQTLLPVPGLSYPYPSIRPFLRHGRCFGNFSPWAWDGASTNGTNLRLLGRRRASMTVGHCGGSSHRGWFNNFWRWPICNALCFHIGSFSRIVVDELICVMVCLETIC